MKYQSKDFSRRSFLAAAGVTTAGLAAGLLGCAPQAPAVAGASSAAAEGAGGLANTGEATASWIADLPYGKQEYDVAEEQEFDIIIVGSGTSGMCAAMEAVDAGAKVAWIDKDAVLGGVAYGTEGAYGMNSQMQKDAGIESPTVAEVVTEELVYTNYRADSNFWADVFRNSGADIDWLIDHGVNFDRADTYQGASTFKCFHWWPGGNGSGMGPAVQEYMSDKNNITIMLNTEVIDLVNEDGVIKGVYVRTENDDIAKILAPATVMGTGGFSENKERVQQLTGLDMTNGQTFGTKSTGEAHDMMVAHGADMATTCLLLNLCVAGYPLPSLDDITLAACYQCLPQVNQNGERFVAEDLFAKKFCALYINALRSQPMSYSILDEPTIKHFETEGIDFAFVTRQPGDLTPNLRQQLEDAVADSDILAFKGDTIADLAKAIGADPAVLQATVDRYNEFTETGVDEDFGCEASFLRGIGEGPYYAVHCDPCIITSIGGINVNRDNQVLNAEGNPIEGLYCTGVESCVLYRETYNFQLSGGMNAYNFYSGRNAVRAALGTKA